MVSLDTAISIFVRQLDGWTIQDLQKAVSTNYSLAQGLQRRRSAELHAWRGLISSARLLDKSGYERFVREINYFSVLNAIRKTRWDLAQYVERTPNADLWLMNQIRDIKTLLF